MSNEVVDPFPQIVLVIAHHDDVNAAVNREISVVNYLMTAFPGHIFICRGSFLLIELMAPRPPKEWAKMYVNLLERSDAIYCHEGYEDPLVEQAHQWNVPVMKDYLDLELFLAADV